MTRETGDGTVGKAVQVLEEVASFGRPVRFSEVLAKSDFPKPTLYRLIQSLTNQGMLDHDSDTNQYSPGTRLVRLAHSAWQQSSLAQVARPYLRELSVETGETVHLAKLDSSMVLYLDKVNAINPVEMYSDAGKVGPAYCTGVGKTMLAHLPKDEAAPLIEQQSFHQFTEHTLTSAQALMAELVEIAEHGYGFDREEHEPGIICVSVPILTQSRRVLGAMSVTSTTQRNNLAGLEGHVPYLRDIAARISTEAQSWSFPDQSKPQTTRI